MFNISTYIPPIDSGGLYGIRALIRRKPSLRPSRKLLDFGSLGADSRHAVVTGGCWRCFGAGEPRGTVKESKSRRALEIVRAGGRNNLLSMQ